MPHSCWSSQITVQSGETSLDNCLSQRAIQYVIVKSYQKVFGAKNLQGDFVIEGSNLKRTAAR